MRGRERARASGSDSRVKQPAGKRQSSAAPGCRGAGCAVVVFPFACCEGTSPLTKCEGAERREAGGYILTPCGVRPVTVGVRLPALHCGVFLRPRDRLLETDRGAHSRTPLIPRGFPRFHPLHQPVAGRTHIVGPGGVSQGPRRPGWLGRTRRRRSPLRQQAPPVGALC